MVAIAARSQSLRDLNLRVAIDVLITLSRWGLRRQAAQNLKAETLSFQTAPLSSAKDAKPNGWAHTPNSVSNAIKIGIKHHLLFSNLQFHNTFNFGA